MIIVVVALMVGGSVGILVAALCNVAATADGYNERPEPDTERPRERKISEEDE